MKKFTLSILVTFALCAATAVAQSGAQRSSPTMGQANSQQQQPGMQQPGHQPGAVPDQTSPSAQTDQNTANENQKTEKTLKGCVESQGGQYVLETKKGSIALMGQDVSAHVGHEVKVKGNWEKGSASNTGAAGTAESSSSASSKSFDVSSVDMVSATCKMKGKGSSSGMGTGTGAGTGSGTSNQPQ